MWYSNVSEVFNYRRIYEVTMQLKVSLVNESV